MSSGLKIYYAPFSRALRVRWVAEELGLDYELDRIDFTHGNVGGDAFKAVNPLQKVPATEIDGQVVLESMAICQLLAEQHSPDGLAVEPGSPEYARYLEWIHYAEGSLSFPLNLAIGHFLILPEDKRDPRMQKWAMKEFDKHLAHMAERGLGHGGSFLVADRLTVADIGLAYPLFMLKLMKQFDRVPQVLADYFDRIRSREAWIRASAD